MGRNRFPLLELLPAQYDALPRAECLEEDFFKYCPLGTMFLCKGANSIDDAVVGVLVKGTESTQIGAPMSPPDRWIDRFRPVIVDDYVI